MCAVVGIAGISPVNVRLYDALTVLQHRGQDAAGIATTEDVFLSGQNSHDDLGHASRQRAHICAQPRPGGYQWKSLFLPHGTEVRMSTEAGSFYAQVDGDVILHKGKSVSPSTWA